MTGSSSGALCGRILIVDDNSIGLIARRSVLEELGHKVVTTLSPHEALELSGKQRFDVVVTDYKMPKMNGVELIGRLRKHHPEIGVVLVAGFVDSLGLNEANTGADVVIQKSAHEVTHLIRSVNRLLRKQQQPKKKPAASQTCAKTDRRKS